MQKEMLGREGRERECGLFGSGRRVQPGQGRGVKAGSWKRKLKKLVGSFPNQETLTSHLYKPTHSEETPQ